MQQHMEAKHEDHGHVEKFEAEAKTADGLPASGAGQRNDWARENGFQMGSSRKTGGYLTKFYEISHDPETKKRHYHCTLCDHSHKSAANVLNHINGQHLKQSWKCVWCDFTTLNSNTLNDHASKKHQYGKWYVTSFLANYFKKMIFAFQPKNSALCPGASTRASKRSPTRCIWP